MNTRNLFLLTAAAVLCATAQAQNGCVNSPENPTALLAVIGGAGAALSALRSRRPR